MYVKSLCIFILFILGANNVIAANSSGIIDNNSIYINDSNVYINIYPHTIYSSQWVYFNLSTKTYTGDIDIAFGFNVSNVRPTKAEYYYPLTYRIANTYTNMTFMYVSRIDVSTETPIYGNDYNTYRRNITYKLPTGNDSNNNTIWSNYTTVVAFDSFTQSGQNYTVRWHNRNYRTQEWVDVSSGFTTTTWYYDNFSTWFTAKNVAMISGTYNVLRVYMEIPISLSPITGKYGFATKPSSLSLEEARAANVLYYIDPWYNVSWGRERPILINNTGNSTILTNYQVNLSIPYDTDMNIDFSDIRIVNDTSLTSIPYYINSSVNSSFANIYFNATYIPANSWLNNTYFLYYNNSLAVSESSAQNTFSLYDDFESQSGWNFYTYTGDVTDDGWMTDLKHSGSYAYRFGSSNLIHDTQYGEIKRNLSLSSGSYIVDYWIARHEVVGYNTHIIENSVLKSNLSRSNIQGFVADTFYKNTNLITLLNGTDFGFRISDTLVDDTGYSQSKIWIDDVTIRKYVSPEPIALLGVEQTLPNSFASSFKIEGVINNTLVTTKTPNFTWVPYTNSGIINSTTIQVWNGSGGTGTKFLDYVDYNISYFVYNGTELSINSTYYVRIKLNSTTGIGDYFEYTFFYGQRPTITNVSTNNNVVAGGNIILTFNVTENYFGIGESIIMITRSQEGALANKTLSGGNIIQSGNNFTLIIPTSTTVQYYNITMIEVLNSWGFSNTTNYTPISILTISGGTPTPTSTPGSGSSGGGGGGNPSPTVTTSLQSTFNMSLQPFIDGARPLSDIESISKCLTDSFFLSNQCTGAAMIIITDSTNWFTMLGVFFASILTLYGLNIISRKKRSYLDAGIYSIIIILTTLVLNLLGFNAVFLFNYLFSNSISALTFASFVLYGIVGTIILDEIIFKKPMIYTIRKVNI